MEDLMAEIISGGIVLAIAIVGLVVRLLVKQLENLEPLIAAWIGEITKKNGVEIYNKLVSYATTMVYAARDKARNEGWDGQKQLDFAVDAVYDYIERMRIDGKIPFALTKENVDRFVRGIYQESAVWMSEWEPGVPEDDNTNDV
jgi:hypothetical protein